MWSPVKLRNFLITLFCKAPTVAASVDFRQTVDDGVFSITPLEPGAAYLYPLKTSENL